MEQAMKNGLESWFQPLPDQKCPYCGRILHQLTHTVASGQTYLLGIYEICDCEGAVRRREQTAAAKAKQEQYRVEQLHQGKVDKLLKAMDIPARYTHCTLQNYSVPPGDQRALEMVSAYVERFGAQRKKGMGLYLHGANGLGKTHLAYAIARALCEKEHAVICKAAVDILLDFRAVMDGALNETEYTAMRAYVSADLLVVDDLGKEHVTDWSLAQFFGILDGRYRQMRPTIVTTNYVDDALIRRLALQSDRETATGIVSRLHGMAYDVPMSGKDYRSQ
ncbi:ATP-binding protein [Ethanoligenens harbinense]|uniref:IstB domain protein ATP-binding protein n=1 Tax=Ethanoligenens harbinense (strain DSM 18485 / JCM 12961 / CGMCC 1.5033 / YUAN-3) TaxID=663278 RepID=E6U937_ETHHY|nr:ATP-binding protein [Ethanoligenens harbinense]ADU26101.1 IstB domain protein ATP-binding protein [Ethanoligenens harbinense YUAN-3]AVQ95244.1 ATP-binding protein [Ethanoligenens harbinense YUAN-3]AYF37935.1 ATP-binding protein [Ethanoligenens harbinense]AYF40655.1 ATP-binding protein [Ethanoligenens harbinense]QCN91489.1 ATP-binding protein [Ethanoligenens harbinense]